MPWNGEFQPDGLTLMTIDHSTIAVHMYRWLPWRETWLVEVPCKGLPLMVVSAPSNYLVRDNYGQAVTVQNLASDCPL